MRGKNTVHWRPYVPMNRKADADLPYICRLAPDKDRFTLEWFDKRDPDGAHTLYWGLRDAEKQAMEIRESVLTVDGLECDCASDNCRFP